MNDELTVLLREIRDELRGLRALVERGRVEQPAAPATGDLLRAIVLACGDRLFTSRELLEHADVAPALRAALGSVSARRLGKLLARIEGRVIDGLCVHRIGTTSHVVSWMVKAV
jgi:hypothetical protein